MSDLQYQPISDAIRRALIRYCTPYTEIFGEYCPLLVNSGALNPAFTAKQLQNALDHIGIKVNIASLYQNLSDPHNPVVNRTKNHSLLSKTTIFGTENGAEAFYLRPRHEMLDILETIAYFRECEMGYRRAIPPVDVYDGAVSDEERELIESLYSKIKRKKTHKNRQWVKNFQHFSDFREPTRTEVDNALVTKPSLFKLAFFEAVIYEGEWSGAYIERFTGIQKNSLNPIVKKSNLIRKSRRVIITARSYMDALEQVNEPGYAIWLSDNTYLVQLMSVIRAKTDEEMAELDDDRLWTPQGGRKKRKGYRHVKREVAYPGFQDKFLAKSLRLLTKTALNLDIPLTITTTHDIMVYLKKRRDENA